MSYFDRIHYDAETGVFTWAVAGRGIRVGAVAGVKTSEGYWQIKLGFKAYRAHRLAWFLVHGVWPDGSIDHINGDRLDNRIANLRIASHAVNMQNKRVAMANNKSCGLLGVTWNIQHERWQASVMVNKKRHFLGHFDTPEAAHAAYLEAKRRLQPGCTI